MKHEHKEGNRNDSLQERKPPSLPTDQVATFSIGRILRIPSLQVFSRATCQAPQQHLRDFKLRAPSNLRFDTIHEYEYLESPSAFPAINQSLLSTGHPSSTPITTMALMITTAPATQIGNLQSSDSAVTVHLS
jgi:hypothetical protein